MKQSPSGLVFPSVDIPVSASVGTADTVVTGSAPGASVGDAVVVSPTTALAGPVSVYAAVLADGIVSVVLSCQAASPTAVANTFRCQVIPS